LKALLLFLISWNMLKRKARIRWGGRSGSGKKRTKRKEGRGQTYGLRHDAKDDKSIRIANCQLSK